MAIFLPFISSDGSLRNFSPKRRDLIYSGHLPSNTFGAEHLKMASSGLFFLATSFSCCLAYRWHWTLLSSSINNWGWKTRENSVSEMSEIESWTPIINESKSGTPQTSNGESLTKFSQNLWSPGPSSVLRLMAQSSVAGPLMRPGRASVLGHLPFLR